jgi:nicotinate-nucleotide--dimethylbenzimidazole phosphoribosyltransferase
MQNTLKPRFHDPQLVVFAADHGIAVDGLGAARPAPDPSRCGSCSPGQLPLAVFARSQQVELSGRRLRHGEQHASARPAADAQDRARHAQRARRPAMTLDQAHAACAPAWRSAIRCAATC